MKRIEHACAYGGIAGLALAYWLNHYGISVVIIERAASTLRDGYGKDFYGTDYDVAERMGLLEELRKRQLPFEDIADVNHSGKRIAHLNITLMRRIMRNRYMALMHWTLEKVLSRTIGTASRSATVPH